MKKELLRDRVYREVAAAITAEGSSHGVWIVENDICRDYGVSKSTAGEVLHRLVQEGVLVSYPRKGYRLNLYNQKDFVKIQRLRFVVESLALQQLCAMECREEVRALESCTQDNSAFHMALAKITEDPFICETLENLINRCERTYLNLCEENLSGEELDRHHRLILESVLSGDARAAVEALRQDLQLDEMNVTISEELPLRPKKRFTTADMEKMRYLCMPALSPDGGRALVTVYRACAEDGKFYPDVFETDLSSMRERRLPLEGNAHHAAYLPCGSIALLCDRSGEDQLYVVDAAGGARKISSLRHGVKGFAVAPDLSLIHI